MGGDQIAQLRHPDLEARVEILGSAEKVRVWSVGGIGLRVGGPGDLL